MDSKIQPDFSTPLSSLNITPTPENISLNLNALSVASKSILPKICISSFESSTPSAESAETETNKEIENHDVKTPDASPASTCDRDTLIIQNIVDAKLKLDEILICMKLNLPQNVQKSPLFCKPKPISPSPSKAKPNLTLNSVNRRLSAGGVPSKLGSPVKKYVRPVGVSKIASMIKGDTPRPIIPKSCSTGAIPKQIGKALPVKSSTSLGISTSSAIKLKK